MLMTTGKLDEAGMKTSIRSFKSLMYRASVLFLMATGTACFPGTADEFERAISECDISALDQFDLTEEERESILSRCNNEQDRNIDPTTGVEYDDAGRPMTDDERDYENNDGSEDEHRMVDMADLEEFSGEWIFVNQTGSYRNADPENGGVLIAHDSNFSDAEIRVLVNPITETETHLGIVFRAHEVSPGQGEGYFAIVNGDDFEFQLQVGFHYADGHNEILDSMWFPTSVGSFNELKVVTQGCEINVSYNGQALSLCDDRSRSGAVGLVVTQGIGEFTDFIAEGVVEPGPDFGNDDSMGCSLENDSCPDYNDFDGEVQTLNSLRTHQGEWFNDGDIAGNVESDDAALQITGREFGDVYLRTRMLTQTEDTKMGIIFRANPDEDANLTGYFTGLNAEDNQLVLGYHHGNGENQILATAYVEVNVGEFYDIDVEAYGSHIRVNCNGVSLEIESNISDWGVAGLIATDGLAIFTEFEAIEIMD